MGTVGCPFCARFGPLAEAAGHPVFDRVLWATPDFVVVPTRGAFVEGYVLLIPRRHCTSLGSLGPRSLGRLETLRQTVAGRIAERFGGDLALFEHGIVDAGRRMGACIDHAHLHCVPGAGRVVDRLARRHELRAIAGLEELAGVVAEGRSYLYVDAGPRGRFYCTDTAVPSQYLRRLIAEQIGMPDAWDWAACGFEQKAARTVQRLLAGAERDGGGDRGCL